MTHIEKLAKQIIKDKVVIKCIDKEQGAGIIKAFKERGIDTGVWGGTTLNSYYGIFGKSFNYYSYSEMIKDRLVLTLPQFIERYPLKEIIGWKFKDIAGIYRFLGIPYSDILNTRKSGIHIEHNSQRYHDGVNSGILEILCEPVYKEEEKDSHILFAQWLSENEWVKRTATHPNKVGKYYSRKHCVCKTIEELFEMFKNR